MINVSSISVLSTMDKVVDTLHKRSVMSVVYTIMLQIVLVLLFAFSNIDVFHPIVWITNSVTKLTSFSVWIFFIILCSFLAALCGVLKNKILSGPYLYTNRFDRLRRIFSLNTVFQACLYILIGIIVSCLYLAVIGGKYSGLRRECTYSPGFCVAEEKVFLLYSGAWAGVYVFLHNFFKSYTLCFPVIQQLVFLRLKAELLPSLKQAMKSSLLPCILCPFLYFVNGSVALHITCDVFNLTSEEKLFSNFIDYLNFSLLFYAWLQNTVLIFSCKMVEHILNIFLTDLPEFPIACQFGEVDVGTLHEVIAANKYPVIQNWGCLDLFSLAKSDRCRRKEIFALSQPGGHPNNWNAIRKECLQLTDTFVERLNVAISEMTTSQTDSGEIPSIPAVQTQRILREVSPVMRNLSLVGNDTSLQFEPLNEEPLVVWHKIFEHIVFFVKGLIPPLLKKTGLNHIFDKFPDAQLKLIFANSLPVVNAVQGLSFLVAASLTEDEYGVVQKDLNTIIIAIQQLKLTVDRALKIGNFKRAQKNEQSDMQMKAALKSALKRSLYKICVTYKDHIQELDLPPSVYNSLQMYLSFRE